VQENGQVISGAIRAVVTDTISLTLMPANWYSTLPHSNTLQAGTAEWYVLKMMQINQAVFGNKKYDITDRSLFISSNYDTAKTKLQVELMDSTVGTTNNLVQTSCSWVRLTWQCEVCYLMSCPLSGSNLVQVCYEYEDGSGSGGGGSGGGSGGGNPIPPIYPCTPYPPVSVPFTNNVIPANPLPPCTPAPGTGWIPVFYDIVTPPFTWIFTGDDGTTFTDPDPLEEPDFVLDPTDNYEVLYPRFSNMVRNLKTFVKNNPKVLNALQTWSGFSKQQILNHLTYGQGPKIKVEEMTGRYAWYKKEPGNNTLKVRASYVRGLEVANLEKTKEGTAFLLAVSILHEYIHLGTNHNNISEGKYDFGLGFEMEAFNVIVEDNNANTIVIKFSQYF